MQVTATLSEGLKREFRVVVPVSDLAARADARLDDLKGRVNINGFRPGKVPMHHLKKLYGKAVLAETIETLVGETNQKIVEDNGFKLAQEPAVKLPEAEADAKAVFEGQADLDYTVAFEVLPTIQIADFKGIKVEKPVVQPSDEDVEAMLETMAKQNRPFEPKTSGAAEDGDRLTGEYAMASRRRVKRELLDALDERHAFDLPQSLVDQEFEIVWRQITQDLEVRGKTFADDGTTEEKAKDEYRKIAERRVRLGLVLAEIGEKAQIKVTDEEVSRAVVERARQFPGQEQQVWDYYRKNAQALASLRAPIFEEKVVDYILELAEVTEKTVSKDELFKDNEDEEAA
jgi:FKBP-type peptidyl-prolyl cis-trans isomerase (trigger factor)